MDKAYNPQQYEDALYSAWEESGLFNPDNLPQRHTEPFAVMMPPPNVTGVLHLGHALENTIMDTRVRYERMRGKRTLLLPGTDHSAVATQARVEDNLKKEGIENPRQELGREGLLEKIREFAEESKATILGQVRKMGTSGDWSRLAYTFDEDRSRAVNKMFIDMYNDGLIYRGHRVVNWSITGQSTASDDELEYDERTTTLYTFTYSADFPIPIATVLPETKLGDTAVAVHPQDDRYKEYIGQQFTVDVGAAAPLTIHVIGDEEVDPEYGTGALGVTPAHAMTDFEILERHPEIGMIQVIGEDGTMTEATGQYAGMPYKEAREKFVQWLRDNNLMINEEEVTHSVALSDRFKDEIWPMPKEQWFLGIDREIPGRGKTIKQLMQEAVTDGLNGDPEQKITIKPDRFRKTSVQWIDNYRDWCISRQIWWGHRIPVWYRGDEVVASETQPEGDGWEQDPDTLDTWFSSAAWTFSTLGWPEETPDLQAFHPTGWMQMGHEIIRLWLVRMILMSTYNLDQIPFRDVYIHGILRDKKGDKFSKSAGNGIDPLEVIEQYGADALRMSLVKGIAPGNDARFYEEKVEDARNFVNKLWNVARFVQMQEESTKQNASASGATEPSIADRWIVSRLHALIEELHNHYQKDEFSPVAEKIYDFLWREYADWYVEMSKIEELGCTQRMNTLERFLRVAHPLIPFVTEQISHELGFIPEGEYLMVAEFPQTDDTQRDAELEKRMESLFDLVRLIRDAKASADKRDEILEVHAMSDLSDQEQRIVERLAGVAFNQQSWSPQNSRAVGNEQMQIELDLGVADQGKIKKEIAALEEQIARAEARLANEEYVNNAPAEIVQQTRDALEQQLALLEVKKKDLT